MKKEILPKYLDLTDLALIATLRYFGITEENIDRSNPSKIRFVFWVTEGVNKIIKDYYAGKLAVEPQAFFLHLKAVKGRIYSQEISC